MPTGANGILLGDSGYGLRRYLLTPFLDPSTPAEERFNKALTITRARIEHTFGVVKNRFRCLIISLRQLDPKDSLDVITACLVLHNIGVMNRDLYDPLPAGEDNQGNDPVGDNTNAGGTEKRNEYVREYFSQ